LQLATTATTTTKVTHATAKYDNMVEN